MLEIQRPNQYQRPLRIEFQDRQTFCNFAKCFKSLGKMNAIVAQMRHVILQKLRLKQATLRRYTKVRKLETKSVLGAEYLFFRDQRGLNCQDEKTIKFLQNAKNIFTQKGRAQMRHVILQKVRLKQARLRRYTKVRKLETKSLLETKEDCSSLMTSKMVD